MTASVPKSVSILFAVGNASKIREMQDALTWRVQRWRNHGLCASMLDRIDQFRYVEGAGWHRAE